MATPDRVTRRTPPTLFETLESRRLLSVALAEGVLRVVGTHKSDHITITIESSTPDQATVEINNFVRRFKLSDIEEISIQAGQGHDFVQIDPGKGALNMQTRLYGSGGDDTLTGGAGPDRAYGGSGKDIVESNSGRDVIYGESGGDTIEGGRGNDYIDGGDGNDSIDAGPGIDRIFGGPGDDRFESRDETSDSVSGGPDSDDAFADRIDGLVSVEERLN
jgi:Ca2+-binding RTX toxin-like protein